MRYAVILLFVVPQAVSLLLCCCTLGAKTPPSETATRTAPIACELCCHELPPNDTSHDNLGRSTPGCPCRQMMVSLLVGTPGTLETVVTVDPAQLVASILIEGPTSFAAPILAPARVGELAFHPPDYRQRHHHVLRC